jgi:hypothetical protein
VNNNYNSNTVVKQDSAVVKQVDGRAAHMTDTTQHQSWQSTPPPYQIMLDPSLVIPAFAQGKFVRVYARQENLFFY